MCNFIRNYIHNYIFAKKRIMSNGLKGIFIILFYLVIGEAISFLINEFIPGNVIGMILLFISLQIGFVKEESIEVISSFITENMTILYLPPSIGLMASYKLLGDHIITILLAIIVSTLLVITVVGKLQDKIGKDE